MSLSLVGSMRLDSSRRALLLLLGCLVTALVFPRACSETRTGLGVLLPATAPLTGSVERLPREDALRMALAAQQTELLRLRELLDARPDALPESLADLEFEAPESASRLRAVPARVLHRDVSRTRRAFLVDTGEERGVYRGLAVAYGNCLVGVVRTTARDGAQVVRIDDPARDNVYPAVVRPRDGAAEGRPAGFLAGVARGAGDGHVIVSHLGEGAARVGDLVVTGAGRFGIPEGLVMGEVVRFDDDDRDGIWEARVRPLRDLDTLVSVLIYVRPPLDPALRSRRR